MSDRNRPGAPHGGRGGAEGEENDRRANQPAESDVFAGAVAQDDPRQLRAELDESRDRLLRTTAELENFRKRAARELENERRYASLPLLRDLVSVMDNIQRAIEAAEKSGDGTGLLSGFKLVAQQLEQILKSHHCTRIEALGHPFDPHLHEAISHLPSAEHPPDTVMAEAAAGYQLYDRVVRHAQVVVSAPPHAT